jgi:uncharacterized RDD family membrane protein YckC
VTSSLTAAWSRTLAVLGRVSMYRLVVLALAVLAAIALVLSFAGAVGPSPWELLATLVVLAWPVPRPTRSRTACSARTGGGSPRSSPC